MTTSTARLQSPVEKKYRGIRQALRVEAGLLVMICLVLVALELGWVASSGAEGLASLFLALAPVPLLFAFGLWLDRFEPEPVWLLMRTFLWGAAVAIMVAGILNSIVAVTAGEMATIVVSAPLVEEAMKGLAVLWVFRRRQEHLNGVLDGIIYAIFVGLGFAVVENVQYYLAGYQQEGAFGLAGVFFLRGILTPFLHPFFTMFTAIGLGLALKRRGAARVVLPLLGYCAAVFLHALWNSGIGVVLYPFMFVPAFIYVSVRIMRHRREEAALLVRELAPEAEVGLITPEQLRRLCQPPVELRSYFGSLRNSDHPLHDWRELHHAAFSLACHRRDVRARLPSGSSPSEADRNLDHELRSRIWTLRHGMEQPTG